MKHKRSPKNKSNTNPFNSDSIDSVSVQDNAVPELSLAELATFKAISQSDEFSVQKALEFFKGVKRPK